MLFKKKQKVDKFRLCEGIKVDESVENLEGNRIYKLILNGVMVYFLSAGSILGYLSATGTKHAPLLINIIMFIAAMFLSCIYYNKKIENIGNIFVLIVLVISGFTLSLYINSGFYAVLNDLNVFAKKYFDFTGIRTYAEPIPNRELAVNVAFCFLGVVMTLLINLWMLKRTSYMDALIIGIMFCMIPVYIQQEPDLIYIIMLVAGTVLGLIQKRSSIVKKSNRNRTYRTDSTKTDSIILTQLVVILVFVAMVLQVIVPKKDYYEDTNRVSYAKSLHQEKIGNLWKSGLMGLFNKYQSNGGMNSGRLGGVASVNLDYNTDFEVTLAPYSYKPIYLKEKHYVDYVPYKNRWTREGSEIYLQGQDLKDSGKSYGDTLKEAYESGNKKSSKAIMDIKNVSGMAVDFTPYYASNNMSQIIDIDEKVSITYYPRLAGNDTKTEQIVDEKNWLGYSVANSKQLANLCKEAGLRETMDVDTMVSKLAAYFQKNIPYTLNPGNLESGKDFVNDFLEDKKKGYCVHFATTGVLALRYMGVQARYVEGYMIRYSDIISGSMDIIKKYGDYYDGYTQLGETAVVKAKLTDANAHAWIEVYDKDYGWKVAELTPSASMEDNRINRGGFWDNFMKIFYDDDEESNGDNTANRRQELRNNADIFTTDIVKYVIYILVAILLLALISVIVKVIIYRVKYFRADLNDKVIMNYTKFLKKKRRKYKELRNKINYKDQLECMKQLSIIKASDNEYEKLLDILNKAGFSNSQISKEEGEMIKQYM